MIRFVYELDGPVPAIGTGEYYDSVVVCSHCGRTRYWQARNAEAELYTPADRNVWITDGSFIFLDTTALARFGINLEGMFYQPVKVLWSQNEPDQTLPLPTLLQLRSHLKINLHPSVFVQADCSCKAISRLKRPWLFLKPEQLQGGEGIWQIAQSPRGLVISRGIRDALLDLQPDLKFIEHPVEE